MRGSEIKSAETKVYIGDRIAKVEAEEKAYATFIKSTVRHCEGMSGEMVQKSTSTPGGGTSLWGTTGLYDRNSFFPYIKKRLYSPYLLYVV